MEKFENVEHDEKLEKGDGPIEEGTQEKDTEMKKKLDSMDKSKIDEFAGEKATEYAETKKGGKNVSDATRDLIDAQVAEFKKGLENMPREKGESGSDYAKRVFEQLQALESSLENTVSGQGGIQQEGKERATKSAQEQDKQTQDKQDVWNKFQKGLIDGDIKDKASKQKNEDLSAAKGILDSHTKPEDIWPPSGLDAPKEKTRESK